MLSRLEGLGTVCVPAFYKASQPPANLIGKTQQRVEHECLHLVLYSGGNLGQASDCLM